MKIAYLILAHTDPKHVARLANRISEPGIANVFIHIDKKVDILPFKKLLSNNKCVHFNENRVVVNWGGISSVTATLSIINQAREQDNYDRFVLLQGLDYPLISNKDLITFFQKNRTVEYIRACKITGSLDKYHSMKSEQYWFFDYKNLLTKLINKFNTYSPFKLRKGYIMDDKKYDIYWGCAQWALTGNCVDYIVNFSKKHEKFNRYFKYVFPPDETYFHTIIFNSEFSAKTFYKGPEPEKRGLVNWKNLHYFEYDSTIKIFTESDMNTLLNSEALFFRKVTTEKSSNLLDKLDSNI